MSTDTPDRGRGWSRRRFLGGALGLAGVAALARAGQTNRAGFDHFVCDWTIRQTCNPEAFAVAKRIGLDGVQVDFGRLEAGASRPRLFDPEMQERITAAAETTGVAVASLAFGVLNNVPYKRDPDAEQWVLDSVDVLKRLRQRVALLAFFAKGDLLDDEAGVAETIRRLRRLAPRAEAAGVTYGIESWLKVPALERILDAVNSPAIQVYYHVGNMQKVGEDVGVAIRRLGRERICEVHFKDYDDLYGKGSMDFPTVRRALDDIGYRGWVGIEGVKTTLGIEESMRYNLDYLRPLFPRKLKP